MLILTFASTEIYSQEKGEITGRVIDKSNQQILSDVTVSLIKESKIITGAQSDQNGFYKIPDVIVGEYTLRFSLIGFESVFIDNIVVNSGVPTDVQAELMILSTEEIQVVEERFVTPSDVSNSFKSLQYEEIRRNPGGFEDIGRVVQT